MHWKCPNCKEKVDFAEQMSLVFDEDGKSEFDAERGLIFHTIMCDCGANWTVSISDMEVIED